ncbi:hypothetical protein KCP70_17800 [Salmonella enterica subsp. enterica]|nr:hypothetical protein KCP70_17800 [Salmonella enterica subsp. enterica]
MRKFGHWNRQQRAKRGAIKLPASMGRLTPLSGRHSRSQRAVAGVILSYAFHLPIRAGGVRSVDPLLQHKSNISARGYQRAINVNVGKMVSGRRLLFIKTGNIIFVRSG